MITLIIEICIALLELMVVGIVLLFFLNIIVPFHILTVLVYLKYATKDIARVTGNVLATFFSIYFGICIVSLIQSFLPDTVNEKIDSILSLIDTIMSFISGGRSDYILHATCFNAIGEKAQDFSLILVTLMAFSTVICLLLYSIFGIFYSHFVIIGIAVAIDIAIYIIRRKNNNENIEFNSSLIINEIKNQIKGLSNWSVPNLLKTIKDKLFSAAEYNNVNNDYYKN